MRKIIMVPISILVACGAVYTAGSAENPPVAAAPPTASTAPAVPTTTPAAVPTTTPAAAPTTTPAAAPTTTPAAAPAAAPAAVLNLSGKWLSNLIGDVAIEQKDNKITATYQYTEDNVTYDGKIEGLIKDKLIQAKWWARPKVGSGEESRGDLEWKIADDGKMLVGWYREEGEKEKYDLNLQR